MLTVFISPGIDDAKALARTLNALIGATVDGLVREVVLLADGGNLIAAKIADDAGCAVVPRHEFAAALTASKSEWLMFLEAGSHPEQGWEEAVSNHIQSGGKTGRFARSPLAKRPVIWRIFQSETPLALGLIIEKRIALGFGETAFDSPAALAKNAKPKPMQAFLRPA